LVDFVVERVGADFQTLHFLLRQAVGLLATRLFLDLAHDDAAEDFVLLLDEFGLGGGDIAELHRGQCAGHFVVFFEKLVVGQLQLIEPLAVIFELGLRQGQFGPDLVEVGIQAGNDLLFRRGIAFHSLDLRGRGREFFLQLLVGLDEIGRFFEG